ncbi:MAG: calcium/sodium antiporter [Candidatus Omnitrophota bacterium]|nr:calcium/sodium antiporter [Candidatus Omnitrophota bacterium]
MLTQSIVFIFGLVLLITGAGWLVRGSSNFAGAMGIKPVVIALTFIAFGTSAPEAAVSIVAVIKGAADIALGDVIGSNIANIGLVLGLTALVSPLKIERRILRRELPIMIGAAFLLYLMALDLKINFFDGLILLIGLILFVGFLFFRPALASEIEESARPILDRKNNKLKSIFLGLAGLVILLSGAYLMVYSGTFIAGALGIKQWVIALTVFAVGTSLPELATSVVSAFRGKEDIAVGNIIGSNILNILFVIGITGMIGSLAIDVRALRFTFPVMLAFSVALVPLIKRGFVINRLEGAALVLGYFTFLFFLVRG